MIILIDNYDSFTFNLVHYLGGLGADAVVHRNDKISVAEVMTSEPDSIVLSPGPCTSNEAGICPDLIGKAVSSIPILGVCLGHQAIGSSVRRQSRARDARARQSVRNPAQGHRRVPRHQWTIQGDALSFAGGRPRQHALPATPRPADRRAHRRRAMVGATADLPAVPAMAAA